MIVLGPIAGFIGVKSSTNRARGFLAQLALGTMARLNIWSVVIIGAPEIRSPLFIPGRREPLFHWSECRPLRSRYARTIGACRWSPRNRSLRDLRLKNSNSTHHSRPNSLKDLPDLLWYGSGGTGLEALGSRVQRRCLPALDQSQKPEQPGDKAGGRGRLVTVLEQPQKITFGEMR
jgi:hypothetical protein